MQSHQQSQETDDEIKLTRLKLQLKNLRKIKTAQFDKINLKYIPPKFPIRLYPTNVNVYSHN